ncbi:MAG: histidine phosphatase family protein [Gemmobacter sp.]
MVTRFWWVRHGPTHAKCMVGWSDLPADLSDHAALARLSAHLPGDAVVVSSDLSRAIATADAIQGRRERLPHDADLREIHFGTWEMRAFAEVEAEAPDHIRAFWQVPGDVAAPEGESWNMLAARVDAAIDRLLAAHPGRDIIVTAHFGAILAALQRAEGLSPEAVFAHRIDNLSVTCLACDGSGWRSHAINHRP